MLLTTITEFKQYIAIEANTHMATLAPYVKEAEMLYIIPILGQGFYDEVLEEYKASKLPVDHEDYAALPEVTAELLPYIQRALAYYTQLQAIPHLQTTFGELGIRQHRGEDSDVAPKWLQDKLQMQALKNGDIHADKLLEYLEANAADFTTWADSEQNTKAEGVIVYSTAVASQHIQISESRRVYLRLKPTIQQLEKRFVPKLIGQAQYDDLVDKLQLDATDVLELTEPFRELVIRLESIISKRALFMQLPYMRISIAGDGIWMYSESSDLRSKDFLASKEEVKILRCELMDGELGYLADEQDLRQFIKDNILSFPLIAASTAYTVQPDPGPTWRSPEPDANSKWFAV